MSFPYGVTMIPGTDIVPSRVTLLTKVETNAARAWYLKKFKSRDRYIGIAAAYAATTSGRNDTILVTPQSHLWSAALTWANSNTHLVGLGPFTKGGAMRSRFGHSGYTMANFLTVSGSNNLFQNLYWMHGSSDGGAADVNMVTVSGHRNTFRGCHFSGPNNQAQASSTSYTGFILSSTSSHNYFKDCTFGGYNAIHRGANAQLTISSSGQGNIFEDCVFMCRAIDTTTEFIDFSLTSGPIGAFTAIFLNCQFLNAYGNSHTIADAIVITQPETDNSHLYFDSRCQFVGVTDITVSGKENLVWMGHTYPNYNQSTSSPDWKQLGVAGHPETA